MAPGEAAAGVLAPFFAGGTLLRAWRWRSTVSHGSRAYWLAWSLTRLRPWSSQVVDHRPGAACPRGKHLSPWRALIARIGSALIIRGCG